MKSKSSKKEKELAVPKKNQRSNVAAYVNHIVIFGGLYFGVGKRLWADFDEEVIFGRAFEREYVKCVIFSIIRRCV